MSRLERRIVFAGFLILPIGTLLVGCGPDGPEVAHVEGTVTLDGKPLSGAMITFTPTAGGRPSGGRTNEEGWYELIYSTSANGALPGEHSVEISTFASGDPDQDIQSSRETLPARYNVQTELKETVEAGEDNVIDFSLDSEGEVMQPPG